MNAPSREVILEALSNIGPGKPFSTDRWPDLLDDYAKHNGLPAEYIARLREALADFEQGKLDDEGIIRVLGVATSMLMARVCATYAIADAEAAFEQEYRTRC